MRPTRKTPIPIPVADNRPNTERGIVTATPRLDDVGTRWFYSLALEQLGRNLATAGGFEYAYRLGSAHAEIARPKSRQPSR